MKGNQQKPDSNASEIFSVHQPKFQEMVVVYFGLLHAVLVNLSVAAMVVSLRAFDLLPLKYCSFVALGVP